MKTSSPGGFIKIVSALALIGLIPQASFAEGYPRGTLSVARDLVKVNSKVPLNWQIQYPYSLESSDLAPGSLAVGIQRAASNSIQVTKNLTMRVRVLGASFRTNNGHGNNADGVDSSNPGQGGGGPNGEVDPSAGIDDENKGSVLPVELLWSKNYSAWQRVFYGSQLTMVAANSVLSTPVKAGDVIDFGARGYRNSWLPLYSTATSTPNLVILRNGDPVPVSSASFKYGQIKDYLDAYLSSNHKTIRIGSRDLIILMELDGADPNAQSFNLQDLAALVTFE